MTVMIRLPMMALNRPPPLPGDSVRSMKKSMG